MEELGMPADRIFLGYDVVDNGFFAEKSEELGARKWELGVEKRSYFLASARFIEKKNLPRLLRAYARYRKAVEGRGSRVEGIDSGFRFDATSARKGWRPSGPAPAGSFAPVPTGLVQVSSLQDPFDLVLLGDGALRSDLRRLISDLGIDGHVQMPGFKQYEELPSYYARAGAFIHASTTEQWGLVVNEAMASGLPVLVSNRCGCARDLVREGENGWTFDPTDEEQLADLMLRIADDETRRKEMGLRSCEIIAGWGPERFASGLKAAVEAALSAPPKKAGLLDRLILKVLTRK